MCDDIITAFSQVTSVSVSRERVTFIYAQRISAVLQDVVCCSSCYRKFILWLNGIVGNAVGVLATDERCV